MFCNCICVEGVAIGRSSNNTIFVIPKAPELSNEGDMKGKLRELIEPEGSSEEIDICSSA